MSPRRSSFNVASSVVLASSVLVACVADDAASPLPPTDAGQRDRTVADAPSEVPKVDAAPSRDASPSVDSTVADAGLDAAEDAGPQADASVDADADALSADARDDAAEDAGADADADAAALPCAIDGVLCAGGVCCGGACVAGNCCTDTQCQQRADGGAGSVCSNRACVDVAGSLAGLLWQLPCTSPAASYSCNTSANLSVNTTLGGAAGRTYDVSLRFRGVVENKTYAGGCPSGSWQVAGAPASDPYNVYRLSISSPPQTFFLNAGTSNVTHAWAIDFTKTVRIDAGATITLFADAIDGQEILNLDAQGLPITIAGVSPTQPYNGQFIQMDVVSVVLDPYASGPAPTGSAGGALSFAGSQWVTVADSASLHPTALTLESWFQQAAAAGSYNSILGKGHGGTWWDAYTIWYQSPNLNAGLVGGGAWSQISIPWAPDLGKWHHAAFTFDSTTYDETLYIDGLPVVCGKAAGPLQVDSTPLLLGGDIENGAPDGWWNGQLDEVRIFSVARTPEQIWADMHQHTLGPTPGLVGEWAFDEGTGQVCADGSGASNSGVTGATSAVEASDPTRVSSTAP